MEYEVDESLHIDEMNLSPDQILRLSDRLKNPKYDDKRIKDLIPPLFPEHKSSQIKDESKPIKQVEGDGIKDYLKNRFRRDGFNPKSRKVIAEYGSEPIVASTIVRRPISAFSELIVRGTGKTKLPYDKLFHLSIRFRLKSGIIMVEKVASPNAELVPSLSPLEAEWIPAMIPRGLTIDTIIAKTKEYMGERFGRYSGEKNNCQDFVTAIVLSNGIKTDMEFIKQDLSSLFYSFMSSAADVVTGVNHAIDVLIQGKGSPKGVHPLYNTEIDAHFAKQQKIRYLGTHLKNDIPKRLPVSSAIIVNLGSLKGSHWVGIVNHSKKENKCSYFDSFGVYPPPNILRMMRASAAKRCYNSSQLQKLDSVTCGYFCIYYIQETLGKKKSIYDVLYKLTQQPSKSNEDYIADLL